MSNKTQIQNHSESLNL